ncbi:MAG: hypothetical protein M1447_08530, partial [Gammaproteobacteria bacterium]|nr:hypothetical protein [Gammaproteobacteria bacterium]
MVEDERYCPDV